MTDGAVTDGAWRPLLGEETSYECPSDCRLSISFSHRVDRQALQQHLCLVVNGSSSSGGRQQCGRVLVEHGAECDPIEAPCADSSKDWVIIPGALGFDKEYSLILPKGVVVSNVSGPTHEEIKQQLLADR